jgi:putative transcriptional regulator
MSFHYEACGLDEVRLANGYEIHETVYGEAVAIDDVEGLHRAIGRWLIRRPRVLTGAEFRYLRKELDLSQKELAARLGATEQQVFRWEKRRRTAVPGTADRLLRVLYDAHDDGKKPSNWLLEELAYLDEVPAEPVTLEETPEAGWQVALAA